MVERIGSGINRVQDLIAEIGLPPVVFTTDGMFIAAVSRPNVGEKLGEKLGKKLSKNQRLIVEAMLRDNKISQQELADIVGISKTNPLKHLDRQLHHIWLNRMQSKRRPLKAKNIITFGSVPRLTNNFKPTMNELTNQIEIYQSQDGQTQVEKYF